MTTRILPREEWPKLAGTELEHVWPVLDPAESSIVVAEQDGEIVGCWAAIRYWHTECVWVRPSQRRKSGVARALLRAMMALLRAKGARSALTAACEPEIERLVRRRLRGVELPGQHFVFPVREVG